MAEPGFYKDANLDLKKRGGESIFFSPSVRATELDIYANGNLTFLTCPQAGCPVL